MATPALQWLLLMSLLQVMPVCVAHSPMHTHYPMLPYPSIYVHPSLTSPCMFFWILPNPCNQPCERGHFLQLFIILRPPGPLGSPCPAPFWMPCKISDCQGSLDPELTKWSEWSPWSDCSVLCSADKNPKRTRVRHCINEPNKPQQKSATHVCEEFEKIQQKNFNEEKIHTMSCDPTLVQWIPEDVWKSPQNFDKCPENLKKYVTGELEGAGDYNETIRKQVAPHICVNNYTCPSLDLGPWSGWSQCSKNCLPVDRRGKIADFGQNNRRRPCRSNNCAALKLIKIRFGKSSETITMLDLLTNNGRACLSSPICDGPRSRSGLRETQSVRITPQETPDGSCECEPSFDDPSCNKEINRVEVKSILSVDNLADTQTLLRFEHAVGWTARTCNNQFFDDPFKMFLFFDAVIGNLEKLTKDCPHPQVYLEADEPLKTCTIGDTSCENSLEGFDRYEKPTSISITNTEQYADTLEKISTGFAIAKAALQAAAVVTGILGLLAAPFTGGASLVAAAGVIGSIAGLASMGTELFETYGVNKPFQLILEMEYEVASTCTADMAKLIQGYIKSQELALAFTNSDCYINTELDPEYEAIVSLTDQLATVAGKLKEIGIPQQDPSACPDVTKPWKDIQISLESVKDLIEFVINGKDALVELFENKGKEVLRKLLCELYFTAELDDLIDLGGPGTKVVLLVLETFNAINDTIPEILTTVKEFKDNVKSFKDARAVKKFRNFDKVLAALFPGEGAKKKIRRANKVIKAIGRRNYRKIAKIDGKRYKQAVDALADPKLLKELDPADISLITKKLKAAKIPVDEFDKINKDLQRAASKLKKPNLKAIQDTFKQGLLGPNKLKFLKKTLGKALGPLGVVLDIQDLYVQIKNLINGEVSELAMEFKNKNKEMNGTLHTLEESFCQVMGIKNCTCQGCQSNITMGPRTSGTTRHDISSDKLSHSNVNSKTKICKACQALQKDTCKCIPGPIDHPHSGPRPSVLNPNIQCEKSPFSCFVNCNTDCQDTKAENPGICFSPREACSFVNN